MSRTVQRRLESLITWLNRNQATLAARIIRLGRVQEDQSVATAAVRMSCGEIQLAVNPCFVNGLTDSEFAAVMIHESLHVALDHIGRGLEITDAGRRYFFIMGCEAVINDIIAMYYPLFHLPGNPVRGMQLIGCDASDMSADQVAHMLEERAGKDKKFAMELIAAEMFDDHSQWPSPLADRGVDMSGEWSRASAVIFGDGWEKMRQKDAYGNTPAGACRVVTRTEVRKDLRKYLVNEVFPAGRLITHWNRPDRSTLSVYPDFILPIQEPEEKPRQVLFAIDASGSVPDSFISIALEMSRRSVEGVSIRIISFDTKPYALPRNATEVIGGGGTRIEAVEDYIRAEYKVYPDTVFVFTDGFSPKPRINRPERWVWIMTPDGSVKIIPRQSRIEIFRSQRVAL